MKIDGYGFDIKKLLAHWSFPHTQMRFFVQELVPYEFSIGCVGYSINDCFPREIVIKIQTYLAPLGMPK